MKKTVKGLMVIVVGLTALNVTAQKLVSQKTSIGFYSHTAVEDIKSTNVKSVSTLDEATGDVVFSVPMQSFEFEKALMQKHFNSPDFLDTKKEPTAKLAAKISNIKQVDFKKDGDYQVEVKGNLTIKGVTKPISEKGTIMVSGSTITTKTKFNISLEDYGITFKKGKPATNIAKTVEVTAEVIY